MKQTTTLSTSAALYEYCLICLCVCSDDAGLFDAFHFTRAVPPVRDTVDLSNRPLMKLVSPVCQDERYRLALVASLPSLRSLDNVPICAIERRWARRVWLRRRGTSQSVSTDSNVSTAFSLPTALHLRRIGAVAARDGAGALDMRTRSALTRALDCGRVAFDGVPSMRVLTLAAPSDDKHARVTHAERCDACGSSTARSLSAKQALFDYSPRQFECSPHRSDTLVCGTDDGELLLIDRVRDRLTGIVPQGSHAHVLGICWLSQQVRLLEFVSPLTVSLCRIIRRCLLLARPTDCCACMTPTFCAKS